MENGGGGYRPNAVMNNGPGSTRSMQRRSPGAEPGPPPNIPARSISPAIGVGTNSGVAPRSSAAGRSIQSTGGGSRRNNVSSSGFPLLLACTREAPGICFAFGFMPNRHVLLRRD